MDRKNIFELIHTNYNFTNEIKKIKSILYLDYSFCIVNVDDDKVIRNYDFKEFINTYLFDNYKYRDTCMNVSELYEQCDAEFSDYDNIVDDNIIVNFLEVTENLYKLYLDNSSKLYDEKNIKYYSDTFDKVEFLMDTLEKRMGLKKKQYKDRIVLYYSEYKLDEALTHIEDDDVAIELIKYNREKLSMPEKRKVLKQLDTLVEPIIDSIKIKYKGCKNTIWHMADDLGLLLNNFDIRHSNRSRKSNDYIENVAKLTSKELGKIYDYVYAMIIDLLIINDYECDIEQNIEYYKKIVKSPKSRK